MKFFGTQNLLFLISFFSFNTFSSSIEYYDFPVFQRFLQWCFEHKVNVEQNDPDLYDSIIYKNWLKNDVYINYVNSQNLSYKLGHNIFSALSREDFLKLNKFDNVDDNIDTGFKGIRKYYADIIDSEYLAPSIDWRSYGFVSPIQDQGQCGSCWAFSATSAIESAVAIKTGTLTKMSEQQLVDCDNFKHGGSSFGCNGGLMEDAFSWVGKNNGLCSSKNYPYVSGLTKKAGNCNLSCENVPQSDVLSYKSLLQNDDAFMSALNFQTISIAIQADQLDFQLYKSGVFTGNCGTNLNHGVVLVGYGNEEETGLDYYILRNSWGTSWGEEGYMYIGKGSQYNNGQGQCGVLLEGSYPVV